MRPKIIYLNISTYTELKCVEAQGAKPRFAHPELGRNYFTVAD